MPTANFCSSAGAWVSVAVFAQAPSTMDAISKIATNKTLFLLIFQNLHFELVEFDNRYNEG
jgi:hypothetical protein